MNNVNEDPTLIVSIEDQNLEARGDGGHRTSTTRWPTTEEILNLHDQQPPQSKKWETFFMLSCTLAVFNDPLYCYIPVVDDQLRCYKLNTMLMWLYFGGRSTTDLFYAWDIAMFIKRQIRVKQNTTTFEASGKKSDHKTIHLKGHKSLTTRFCKLLPILPRIFIALPFPVATIFSKYYEVNYVLLLICPIQYALRVYFFYGSLRRVASLKTGKGRRLIAVIDFLPFILAAHLYGALWYGLAGQREVDCWVYACSQNEKECDSTITFDCADTSSYFKNNTMLRESCPRNPPQPDIFDFGIFQDAIESNLTRSTTDLKMAMSQSFWWGLRNLSSFGSNLQTSTYMVEIGFSVLISASGLILFYIYLNARMQEAQKISDQLKLRPKTTMMNLDIDLWLSENGVSDNKDLRLLMRKNLGKKLEENKDADVENFLSLLPIARKRRILFRLCLTALKKVPALEKIKEDVLIAICEHLKPVNYAEDSSIVRKGEPLEKMLFFTQGTAWSYTTSANANTDESTDGTSVVKRLTKGDFYGKDLLNWASKLTTFAGFPNSTETCPELTTFSGLPNSTETVKSQTKVKAFAIWANDLRNVISKYKWHFRELGEIEDYQLEEWRHLAASSIQAKWRRCRAHPVRMIS